MFQVHLQDGVFTFPRFVLFFPPLEIGFLRSTQLLFESLPSPLFCVFCPKVYDVSRAERETNSVRDGTPCPQCVIFSTRPFILLSSPAEQLLWRAMQYGQVDGPNSRKWAVLGKRRSMSIRLRVRNNFERRRELPRIPIRANNFRRLSTEFLFSILPRSVYNQPATLCSM